MNRALDWRAGRPELRLVAISGLAKDESKGTASLRGETAVQSHKLCASPINFGPSRPINCESAGR